MLLRLDRATKATDRVPSPAWFEIEAARILALIGALKMPDLGGKKFAEDFKTMLQKEIAKAFEDGQRLISDATKELTDEIRQQSKGAASVIRAEARTVREAFQPTTGNNQPEEEENLVDKLVDPTQPNVGGKAA
jgi:hypothetical protein